MKKLISLSLLLVMLLSFASCGGGQSDTATEDVKNNPKAVLTSERWYAENDKEESIVFKADNTGIYSGGQSYKIDYWSIEDGSIKMDSSDAMFINAFELKLEEKEVNQKTIIILKVVESGDSDMNPNPPLYFVRNKDYDTAIYNL